MKKILFILVTILTFVPSKMKADGYSEFWVDHILYGIESVERNEVFVKGISVDLNYSDIYIPEQVTSKYRHTFTVRTIGKYAMSNTHISSVYIPETVKRISKSAFRSCSELTSVYLPSSLEVIEEGAFRFCRSLISINIPGSVETIGEDAFHDCENLESLVIENGVKTIGKGSFHYCRKLSSLCIPESVTNIGQGAFAYSNIKSLKILSPNTKLDSGAFVSCPLETLDIVDLALLCNFETPNRSLYENLNSKKIALYINGTLCENLIIPNGVTKIGKLAFVGFKIKSVKIPDSVTSIGYAAFSGCSELTSVTIGNSVTDIGRQAFMNCPKLTSITIPNSVINIGEWVFNQCGLTHISIPGNVKKFLGCTTCYSLTSMDIEDGVEVIAIPKNVKEVTLPQSIKEIYYNIEHVNTLTCLATVPPKIGSINKEATIYVPFESLLLYKNHEIWGQAKNIKSISGFDFYYLVYGICGVGAILLIALVFIIIRRIKKKNTDSDNEEVGTDESSEDAE